MANDTRPRTRGSPNKFGSGQTSLGKKTQFQRSLPAWCGIMPDLRCHRKVSGHLHSGTGRGIKSGALDAWEAILPPLLTKRAAARRKINGLRLVGQDVSARLRDRHFLDEKDSTMAVFLNVIWGAIRPHELVMQPKQERRLRSLPTTNTVGPTNLAGRIENSAAPQPKSRPTNT